MTCSERAQALMPLIQANMRRRYLLSLTPSPLSNACCCTQHAFFSGRLAAVEIDGCHLPLLFVFFHLPTSQVLRGLAASQLQYICTTSCGTLLTTCCYDTINTGSLAGDDEERTKEAPPPLGRLANSRELAIWGRRSGDGSPGVESEGRAAAL